MYMCQPMQTNGMSCFSLIQRIGFVTEMPQITGGLRDLQTCKGLKLGPLMWQRFESRQQGRQGNFAGKGG